MSSIVNFFICFIVISLCYFLSTVHCDCCRQEYFGDCPAANADGQSPNKCGDCTLELHTAVLKEVEDATLLVAIAVVDVE
ncbi:hypothetical protein U1Q18_051859 [Sarracenia purpurea var. burkii]